MRAITFQTPLQLRAIFASVTISETPPLPPERLGTRLPIYLCPLDGHNMPLHCQIRRKFLVSASQHIFIINSHELIQMSSYVILVRGLASLSTFIVVYATICLFHWHGCVRDCKAMASQISVHESGRFDCVGGWDCSPLS